MYCSILFKTCQKCNSFGVTESHVLGQNVQKLAKNRGKLENLIFCMIFLFQRMLQKAVCAVPCLVWLIKHFSWKRLWNTTFWGKTCVKLKLNRGKLENPIAFIVFLSKWCIVYASCTVQCFEWHIKTVSHYGLQKATFWGKTYGNWRKIAEYRKILFSVWFSFFN